MKENIELQRVKLSDERYQTIRDRHYVPNHGCVGRQLHYLIRLDDNVVGIISGASAVWWTKPRDEFFGIVKENREQIVGHAIINNVVFRLEVQRKNLATQVLALWRQRVQSDWKDKYNDDILGYETFIYGTDESRDKHRNGGIYLGDNWTFAGVTSGRTKSSKAMNASSAWISVDKKLIFVKKAGLLKPDPLAEKQLALF